MAERSPADLAAAADADARSLDLTYAALASPTRRAILRSLRDERARVTDLARQFPASLATVSKHIQVLERAGLVHREIRGRDHYLTADPSNLASAERWIAEYTSFWERRADSLARHLEEQAHPERTVPPAPAHPAAAGGQQG
jgi:DNA-binding transcriptional ArsR family regulator